MTQKNLDKFSILIAVVAVALTISIMSLTGKAGHDMGDAVQAADTAVTVPADTVLAPADSLMQRPVADTLDAYI